MMGQSEVFQLFFILVLFRVFRASWIYKSMFSFKFGKFLVIIYSTVFSAPVSFSSLLGIPKTHILNCLIFSTDPEVLFIFFNPLSVLQIRSFLLIYLQVYELLCHIQCSVKYHREFEILVITVFSSGISILFFFIIFILLLRFPILSVILTTFSFNYLNIFIKIFKHICFLYHQTSEQSCTGHMGGP